MYNSPDMFSSFVSILSWKLLEGSINRDPGMDRLYQEWVKGRRKRKELRVLLNRCLHGT